MLNVLCLLEMLESRPKNPENADPADLAKGQEASGLALGAAGLEH